MDGGSGQEEASMIVFDTETTGLIENIAAPLRLQPFIIELFALKLDNEGNEIDQFTCLFKPPMVLEDKITQITGITNQMLTGAPKFVELYEELVDFFDGERVVGGHNLKFDISMLVLELRRIDKEHKFPYPSKHICTVEVTEHLKGRRMSLSELHEHLFGETFQDAHSAESDVRANAKCFVELLRRGVIRL